ncbi:MAG: hypothetical protein ACK48U_20735, partial [Planctomyces sp.]
VNLARQSAYVKSNKSVRDFRGKQHPGNLDSQGNPGRIRTTEKQPDSTGKLGMTPRTRILDKTSTLGNWRNFLDVKANPDEARGMEFQLLLRCGSVHS